MLKQASRWFLRNARYLHHRGKRGADLLFRLALLCDRDCHYAERQVKLRRGPGPGLPSTIRFLAVGTTGTCNASCAHCPTGKIETAHVPRGTMPMPLFRKLIDGVVDCGLPLENRIAFGLFGDGLVDPLVYERAEYLMQRMPDARLSINTNGAAYNPAKHQRLFPLVDVIGLHCESLDPETYDYLMQPLRLARVQPKLEMILRDFPGKVHVSVPVSRRNRGELERIHDWFMERGALAVVFDPLSSRCAEDQRLFSSLSFAPVDIRCAPDVMNDLIVDCDGLVLACCQDFRRTEPIGDLAKQSFAETMRSVERSRMRAMLEQERHCEISTCASCRGDMRSPDFPFDLPDAA